MPRKPKEAPKKKTQKKATAPAKAAKPKEAPKKTRKRSKKLENVTEIPVACPHCGGKASTVYNTYKIPGLNVIKRYRRCSASKCGLPFTSTVRHANTNN